MSALRIAKWAGLVLLGLIVLLALVLLVFDPNWLRGPIMRQTTEKTGRALVIEGDLGIDWGWPVTQLSAEGVRFANPEWAEAEQMFTAENIVVGVSLPQLIRRVVFLPEIHLDRAEVFLEQHPDGRKNWLLDREQKDEGSSVGIGTLTVHEGKIRYADPEQETLIDAQVSTTGGADGEHAGEARDTLAAEGVKFEAKGRYKGLPMSVGGTGGPVLSMRDETTPYPLDIDARFASTRVAAEGAITSLLRFTSIDLDVELRGASLDQLFPLIGIALPQTPEYRTAGHLVREGTTWRYEKFSGRIGNSDVSGTLRVDTAGERPFLHGDLAFRTLDFADLGPVVGAEQDENAAQDAEPAEEGEPAGEPPSQVLPTTPFRTDRWNSVDADVTLKAGVIRRPEALPIENLATHLRMRDARLTLDPLEFGVAGGRLTGTVRLDGSSNPLDAALKFDVRRLKLSELFPTLDVAKSNLGELNGRIDLGGQGNSVAKMLGSADGELTLVLADGRISRLMVEAIGLHLSKILEILLAGDDLVEVRCLIADFDAKDGVMHTQALVLDTDIMRVVGSGTIDLGAERLDLTLNPDTKKTALIGLRSPIYIEGTFANPEPSIDTGNVAAQGLGAVALGLINPLLALIPMIEAGPWMDSNCGQLIARAKQSSQPGARPPDNPRQDKPGE